MELHGRAAPIDPQNILICWQYFYSSVQLRSYPQTFESTSTWFALTYAAAEIILSHYGSPACSKHAGKQNDTKLYQHATVFKRIRPV